MAVQGVLVVRKPINEIRIASTLSIIPLTALLTFEPRLLTLLAHPFR